MTSSHPPDIDAPFLRSAAIDAGWTDDQLARPAYTRVFHGVHISSNVVLTLELRCRACLLIAPAESAISGLSAARLWHGIVPDTPGLQVLVPKKSRFSRRGITVSRGDIGSDARMTRGVRVTSPERTFTDLADSLDLVDLVVLGDSLVRRRVTSVEALVSRSSQVTGRTGRLARRAAGYVRAGVDSPMETRLRMLLVLAGLPEPRINIQLSDPDGRLSRRIDLAYAVEQLAIEYDGRHHEETGQRNVDLLRREDLEAAGWRFVVVVAEHMRNPAGVLNRVVAAMRQRGMAVPQLDQGWRDHFVSR
ncbi:MAG TPA: hypothetical protein PK868_11775 [Phycicoccus sp.]|nr:hypothetical protein [Phycicoccus sp.]